MPDSDPNLPITLTTQEGMFLQGVFMNAYGEDPSLSTQENSDYVATLALVRAFLRGETTTVTFPRNVADFVSSELESSMDLEHFPLHKERNLYVSVQAKLRASYP